MDENLKALLERLQKAYSMNTTPEMVEAWFDKFRAELMGNTWSEPEADENGMITYRPSGYAKALQAACREIERRDFWDRPSFRLLRAAVIQIDRQGAAAAERAFDGGRIQT
ncbi:MAG: hypothetical protein OXF88_02910 [Rhodobacteraceae bacterium]|nr:hypothetical protein [Paracoccaceae bacterium]